jgi:uncharacterized protein YjiS (DUF1127 family)
MTQIAHHPIIALSGQMVARALRVFKNRRQVNKLSALSDEALKDIGLTRSDVRRAIALPFHSDPAPFLKQMANGRDLPALQALPSAANTAPHTSYSAAIPAHPRPEIAA